MNLLCDSVMFILNSYHHEPMIQLMSLRLVKEIVDISSEMAIIAIQQKILPKLIEIA